MIRSFPGNSDIGMDVAVKNAHKEYDTFIQKHFFVDAVRIWTTCSTSYRDDMTDYWFVLTVLFDGVETRTEAT